jgi:hypothetical protein
MDVDGKEPRNDNGDLPPMNGQQGAVIGAA